MNVPPGPRGRQVLGFFGRGRESGTLGFLEETARRYGPISSFRLFHKRIYLLDDAELIKEILVNQQHSFERDTGAKLLRELVGDSVITREEPLHKERRRILQPAFHREQIAGYGRIMSDAAADMSAEWQDGQELDVRAEMRRLTLEIVGASLFGADFRTNSEQVSDVLVRAGKKTRWLAPLFYFIEPLSDRYRKWFPHGPSLFFRKERRDLDRILKPLLQADYDSKPNYETNAKSMLALLAGEEGILDELVTFMLAGHETTATALTWAWYLLSRNQQVTDKLHAELDDVFADRSPSSRATLDDLPKLRYTSMVFQEALRLYPPALAFARRAIEEIELGGFVIPKNASVFVSPYITQRNPAYFQDPDEFRPDRWEETAAHPKFAYFPFGGGAKMCIGEPFAKMEGVLALATLARDWMLCPADGGEVGIGPGFILRPTQPIRMIATQRVKILEKVKAGTLLSPRVIQGQL
jgi:cytochrome P450